MIYFNKKNLRSFLKRNCRPFYCIWYGRRRNTWRKTRYLSSAVTGTLCACLICNLIFASFTFSKKYENFVLIVTIGIVGSGFVFTDAIKCITLMIFIALMGKSGRGYLRALCFSFVIAGKWLWCLAESQWFLNSFRVHLGPIENLSANAGEIVRVFSCSKMLAINLTRTRFDLMTKPFQKTLVHMKDDIREVQNTFNELQDVTKALHEEVMGDDSDVIDQNKSTYNNETDDDVESTAFGNSYTHFIFKRNDQQYKLEYVEDRYKNKFKKRCIQQLDNGKARCRKAFASSLAKCHDNMPFILNTLICWPFRVDFICKINILGNPETICDPSDAIPNNFGESYVELASTENKLYEESSDVNVNYTILSPHNMTGIQSAEETAKSLTKEFSLRKRIFDYILQILQRFLGFMILNVLVVCVKYHKNYKKDLEYDNIYISEYFKHIDENRKLSGKHSLLPLKKYEQIKLIDADQAWHRTQEESRAVTFYLLQFSMEIISACFFLFLDYIIVSVLQIIRNNSEMSFVQEGEHTIQFNIQGTGLIARLLRSTMHNFNMHETVSTYLTNEPCLPQPSMLPLSFYTQLFGLYVLVLLLIYHSTTFLRMRRLICGYFYRKREKKRILYLYNRLLKQRRSLRETMLKQAKYNFANRKIRLKANIFLNLRLRWPHHFDWLMKFKVGRRKCVICEEFEDLNFAICKNSECGVSYCGDCWKDMESICLVCNQLVPNEVIFNFNDFFEVYSLA